MTKTYILTQTLTGILAQTEEAKENNYISLTAHTEEVGKYDNLSIVATRGGKPGKEPDTYIINDKTVIRAERLALEKRKSVNTSFYKGSMMGTVFVGEDKMNTKYLVNETDSGYPTNRIEKIYKINEDFIIVTCYAVFIVSSKIRKRKLLRN